MTINDIAKLAGVSVSTVSKIVNGKDAHISETTRNKVLGIVKEYNYSPYSSIIYANAPKTFMLAVLLRSGSGSLILDGVISAAQKHGYGVLLFYSHHDSELELKHIVSICSRNVDGVIWEPVSEKSLDHEHHLASAGISVTYMSSDFCENAWNLDYRSMGGYITQQLIDLGHTKIACSIDGSDSSGISQMVAEGFKQCLLNNNLIFSPKMILSATDSDGFNKMITNAFTGVVCSRSTTAIAFYYAARSSNYSIPANCSLVSLCDMHGNTLAHPEITSVEIPYFAFGVHIGSQAIKKCEKQSADGKPFQFTYALNGNSTLDIPFFKAAKGFVVVGSINMDTTLNVRELPQSGKSIMAYTSMIALGGKGANQAVGIAKLNRQVFLVGKIGNDIDSSLILDELKNYRVSTDGIYHDFNSTSGKAYIHLRSDGESTITVLAGANSKLSREDVLPLNHLFASSCYCLLITESPMDAIMEAAKAARGANVKTILKPAGIDSIPDELLKYIDFFVPNKMEANNLCPDYTELDEQASFFLSKGAKNVIITTGSQGCFFKASGIAKHIPASNFSPVDNTGAADAFIAALATYLSENYPIEASIRIAMYAAGFCISKQGVTSALADRTVLEQYILQHEPSLLNIRRDNGSGKAEEEV